MDNCPECNSPLKQDTAVRVKDNGDIQRLNHYQFCTNMDCTFETD